MILVSSLVLLATQATVYDDAFSARLAKWRTQFGTVLQDPKEDLGYLQVFSESLGPAHANAFYPIGSAAKRFILSFNGSQSYIIQQSRHGAKTLVDWYVPIIESKKKRTVKGTLSKYLMTQGYVISPKSKLKPNARRQLFADYTLAGFSYHHMMGGYGWIVKSDGTCLSTHRSEDTFFAIPEENVLLRQANIKK